MVIFNNLTETGIIKYQYFHFKWCIYLRTKLTNTLSVNRQLFEPKSLLSTRYYKNCSRNTKSNILIGLIFSLIIILKMYMAKAELRFVNKVIFITKWLWTMLFLKAITCVLILKQSCYLLAVTIDVKQVSTWKSVINGWLPCLVYQHYIQLFIMHTMSNVFYLKYSCIMYDKMHCT